MNRLQQFAVGTIVPEWERAVGNRKTQDGSELSMTALLLIEGFLWLHLGVELAAFDRKASEEVYAFYYPSFFRWLSSYNEQVGDGTAFVESSPYLALPEFARIIVRKGMSGGPPLYDQPSGVGENPGLVGPFQSLLILYSKLCRDAAVRRFLYGIGFASPDEWEKQWSRECTAEHLFNAAESEEGPSVAMVLAGYMKFCQYARNTSEVLKNIEGLGILAGTRFFALRERVANMQVWRLNLSSGDTARRFDQIRERLNEMIAQEFPRLGLEDDVKRVQGAFDDSLNLLFNLAPTTA